MQGKGSIDCTDQSLYREDPYVQASMEKDFYTPEEAYELVMSDVKAIYER